MNTFFILLLLVSFTAVIILLIQFIFNILRKKKTKKQSRNLLIAIIILFVSFVGSLITTETKEVADDPKNVEAKSSNETTKKVKEKPLTLEEQSRKFIDENLDGKTIKDFTSALLTLDNDELEKMIVVGHADGQQFTDDFDLLGRKAKVTGKVIDFVEQSRNTYNDRGKKSGSVTFTREDKFTIYMGDKNIEDFDRIEYDSLFHADQDINEFFLGVYPEEIINFVTIDLDEDVTLNIGDTITVEGFVSNYVLNRDYTNPKIVDDFYVLIDNAHVLK